MNGSTQRRRQIRAELFHWLLWLVAVLPVCWRQITTSDCWWHIALGRWLVQRRSLPDFSQFYFTPVNAHVTDLRWSALGDILLYLAHAAGGEVALQVMSLGCVLLGCVFLRRLRPGPMNGWMTALLVVVAFGTYQLQLPRNAMFSLPLTALLFLLFAKYREHRRAGIAWLLPLVVGIWGLLHASCLLGVVLTGLLLVVDAIEGIRVHWPEFARRLRVAVLVSAAALAVATIGNPAAMKMLRRPVSYVFKTSPQKTATAAPEKVRAPVAAPRDIKEWLNNSIWPAVPGKVRSADFSSPLDRLSYRPVGVAFALMFLAAVWACWARGPQFPWIVVFLATTLLGLSYFRMTGYAALGSAALILSSGPLRGRVAAAFALSSWRGAALAAFAAAAIWGAWFCGNLSSLTGNSRHVFAVGKVPAFDEAATRWLLEKPPANPVFTTIVTGSFALERWQGRRRVFIDGFFAPHADSVWTDYTRARRESGRGILREKYAIDYALIEHTRLDWNRVFLTQEDWQPAAIGPGCLIYAHRSVLKEAAPEWLFAPASAGALPPHFQAALARNYYGAILAMLAANRPEAAQSFIAAAPEAYAQWRRWLTPPEKIAVREMDAALHSESGNAPQR